MDASAPVPGGGPAPPLLAVEGSRKSFPGVDALKGVSFDVRAGEVHALLGENGAGKSSRIKIIAGICQRDRGTLRLDGGVVRFVEPVAAQRAGIATIHQEPSPFPELSVAENIFIGHAARTKLGAIDWRSMRARGARAAPLARHLRPRRHARRRLAAGRQPAAGRDRPGAVPGRAHPGHGRADRGADRARRRAPVRNRPAAAFAGRGHCLYQPPDRGDLSARAATLAGTVGGAHILASSRGAAEIADATGAGIHARPVPRFTAFPLGGYRDTWRRLAAQDGNRIPSSHPPSLQERRTCSSASTSAPHRSNRS